MYIANQNFKMGGHMVRRGDKISQISPVYIERGLVREVKIIEPETPTVEVNDVIEQPIIKRRGRKSKAKIEQVEQHDI
jgi:hypothetical protein